MQQHYTRSYCLGLGLGLGLSLGLIYSMWNLGYKTKLLCIN